MNENLTPPHESQSDAESDAARVLAAQKSASHDDESASSRVASDADFHDERDQRFHAEPLSPISAAVENASLNAEAPRRDFPLPDVEQINAPENVTPHNAPVENADVTEGVPPSKDVSAAQENVSSGNTPVAPPRDEDAASTRNARSGFAALIGKVSPRILTALVGIPLVLLVVWQGGALLTGITVLLALTAMRELIVAARKNKTPLVIEWCYLLLLFAMIALWNTMPLWRAAAITNDSPIQPFIPPPLPSLLHLAWPLLALLLVPFSLLLWGVIRYAKQHVSLASIALSTLAIFYVALFAFWPMLRDLTNGFALFVLLLGGVWAGDSAAYFAGRAFGKTRLTPLSPGKTREGFLASCVATLLICALLASALHLNFWQSIVIGLLISVFAPLGDLVESLWKRELNTKDLGAILPGHGGVLDRCDSLLLTAPVVFVYALWQAL